MISGQYWTLFDTQTGQRVIAAVELIDFSAGSAEQTPVMLMLADQGASTAIDHSLVLGFDPNIQAFCRLLNISTGN